MCRLNMETNVEGRELSREELDAVILLEKHLKWGFNAFDKHMYAAAYL